MQLENMQHIIKQIPNNMWINTHFTFNKLYFESQSTDRSIPNNTVRVIVLVFKFDKDKYKTYFVQYLQLG